MSLDTTEYKRAEEALNISEVRYRRLFESAKDGILILDAGAACIIDANPFIGELLGYSHAEFLGKELWEIGLFEDKEASKAAMRELQEKQYIRYEDMPLKTKVGKQIEVEFVSNVYQEGAQSVIQCNIRDLTERKGTATKLQKVIAELSEADRRKNEFLAMLAHELRNPLTPISNGLQLLRLMKGVIHEDVQRTIEIMEKQTHHLTRMVDDLLDAGRITQGKIKLRKESVELAVAMNNAAESIRSHAEARQQILTVVVPPEPVMLSADPTRLEQVLVNLLNNSVKYTKLGGKISLTAEREGEAQVVIRVRDNGVGISTELLPHVFDLFTQADCTLARSEGGLGIGLTMVKRLVELHGGSVEADSHGPNRGSEFVVRLPALPQEIQPIPTEQIPGGRILIVEDVPDSAQMLGMLLKVWGYESRVTYDGPTGLVAFRTYKPDVVLCDIGLPGMSGYEVARMMRKEIRQKRPLLVAVTGYGADEDKRRSHEAGFDFHMMKPPDPAALQKLLAGYTQPTPA